MSTECRLVLAGILAFAGCASAPQAPAENPAVPAAGVSAPSQASAAASETEAVGNTAPAATPEAVRTLEVAKLADNNPVTCRDMLIQGSNVLRTQCMTRNDWKVYEQAQRIWAQDMLLRMQGMKR